KSLTAMTSKVPARSIIARKTRRPIRPKPLIPTRKAISFTPSVFHRLASKAAYGRVRTSSAKKIPSLQRPMSNDQVQKARLFLTFVIGYWVLDIRHLILQEHVRPLEASTQKTHGGRPCFIAGNSSHP